MSNKFNLKRGIAQLERRLTEAQSVARIEPSNVPNVIRPMFEAASVKIARLQKFASQDFKFGTKQEVIDALYRIGRFIEQNPTPDGVSGLWFLRVLNDWDGADPQDLLKALQLNEMGRGRVVDRFELVRKMIALVDSGLSQAAASRECAVQFDCSAETALHWFRRRKELFPK
ncbi:hypothetical protein [Zwartia sp.]|uniref:hypothetical protein n=1 Tax=Zwartia sp. TaxID=2978004 RepID=UPI003BAEC79B